MTVSITSVPSTTRKPGFYGNINTSAARSGLPSTPDKLLLVGTMDSTGTATAGTAVQVYDLDTVRTLVGTGSPIWYMAQAVLEENPFIAELWILPVAESGSGVVATASLVFTASSQDPGVLTVQAGQRAVVVNVASSDTSNTTAAAVDAAINADVDFPFSSSVATNTCTLTAKVKGTHGNKWVLSVSYSTDGVTCAVTQPASGANDFVLSTALANVFNAEFSIVVSELNDSTSLGYLKTHLNDVSGPMEQRPGIGVAGYVGTLGNATTLGSGVNSGRISLAYLRGAAAHPCELAAALAAQIAYYGDDRARPLNNVALSTVMVPSSLADRLTRTEQESLLRNGVCPLEVVSSSVRVVRWVTTYVENEAGSTDDTLLDGMTIRVLDYTREVVRQACVNELAQLKLASVARGPNTTDPEKVRTLILGKLFQLERAGQLQNVEDNADRLVVELDENTPGRLNCTIPCAVIPGLHVIAASFDLIL